MTPADIGHRLKELPAVWLNPLIYPSCVGRLSASNCWARYVLAAQALGMHDMDPLCWESWVDCLYDADRCQFCEDGDASNLGRRQCDQAHL